jgi:hypothetical protein
MGAGEDKGGNESRKEVEVEGSGIENIPYS